MSEETDHVGIDLTQALRAYDEALRVALAAQSFDDVTLPDLDVLARISPQGAVMGQIAGERGVSKQAIQGQVQSLLRRGYVAMRRDPNDARAKQVMLTERGGAVVTALATARKMTHARITEKLGVERTKNMRNMLSQVQSALR